MKELEVELEQLRLLFVEMVGTEQVVCASGSGGGTVDGKMVEDVERDDRESSPQTGRRLRGGKVTGRGDTGRKASGPDERRREGKKWEGRQLERMRWEWGGTGAKKTGGTMSGGKATGAQINQETGGKRYKLMGERERLITVCQVTRLQDRM